MLILVQMVKLSVLEKATLLRDAVFGANDGIITTFAVVAGSQGAKLSPEIVIILGLANLFADGVSMASGNYLGVQSEIAYQKQKKQKSIHADHTPLRHGATTFVSFVVAGFLPLIPFLTALSEKFLFSAILVGATLFLVGSMRSMYTKKSWLVSGFEMFFIGGIAAVVAYAVGFGVEHFLI